MIVQQITHYPPKADESLAHKLLEKPACLSWFSQASLHLSYSWHGGPVHRRANKRVEVL